MKIKYRVHSVTAEEFSAIATVGDKEMLVKIPGIAVEMISDGDSMGHTFRVPVDDLAAAMAAITPGTEAEIDITFGEPAPVAVIDHSAEYAVHAEIAKAIEEGREPPPMPGYEPAAPEPAAEPAPEAAAAPVV